MRYYGKGVKRMAWFVKALNKDEKGFTLIELIVVIAILGILAAIAVPRVTTSLNNAKNNADLANAQIIGEAAERYLTENSNISSIPASTDGAKDNIQTLVDNGYLNQYPKTSTGGSFTLVANIDTNGNLTVTVSAGGKTLYPKQ